MSGIFYISPGIKRMTAYQRRKAYALPPLQARSTCFESAGAGLNAERRSISKSKPETPQGLVPDSRGKSGVQSKEPVPFDPQRGNIAGTGRRLCPIGGNHGGKPVLPFVGGHLLGKAFFEEFEHDCNGGGGAG